ncbi:unnamed protein product [Albugo candida]|uniref:Uncharacterized protein n=1 Tax=Albugo candida TaxID=65357 RepID=A0A024FX75_9STRA|nr:unnamed protein product [Albugo candida]|eukprot:CCI11269.1 unnamed protein product [Albugo candida]
MDRIFGRLSSWCSKAFSASHLKKKNHIFESVSIICEFYRSWTRSPQQCTFPALSSAWLFVQYAILYCHLRILNAQFLKGVTFVKLILSKIKTVLQRYGWEWQECMVCALPRTMMLDKSKLYPNEGGKKWALEIRRPETNTPLIKNDVTSVDFTLLDGVFATHVYMSETKDPFEINLKCGVTFEIKRDEIRLSENDGGLTIGYSQLMRHEAQFIKIGADLYIDLAKQASSVELISHTQ